MEKSALEKAHVWSHILYYKNDFLLLNETLNIYIFLSEADFAANDMITFFC